MDLILKAFNFVWFLWLSNLALTFLGLVTHKKKIIPDYRLDAGKNFFDGKRIFGDAPTWGGLIMSVILGISASLYFYSYLYLIKSLCAFLGNTLGSFIKRRFSYKKGEFLPVIDHGDYVLLFSLIALSFNLESKEIILISILLTYIFHPVVCLIGFKLGIKSERL